MSLATAIKSGDTVFVGTDSLSRNGDIISVVREGHAKAWKLNDAGVVFAHSGITVNKNIISTADRIIDTDFVEKTIQLKDVVNNIVPKMMTLLESKGQLKTEYGCKSMQSDFILAHKDKLFTICGNGCVMEPSDDYASIGCGEDIADGAFQVINRTDSRPR